MVGFHIETGGKSRSFFVAGLGNGFDFICICRLALKVHENHVLRQENLRCAPIGRVFDLYHQGNDGIFFSGFPAHCNDQVICVQGFSIDMSIHTVVQVCYPFRNGNTSLTGGNGQPHATDIAAGWCIRQIVVKHLSDLAQVRFPTRSGSNRVFHRGVGGCKNSCPHGIGVLHTVITAFRFRDLVIQILCFIQRCAGFFLRSNSIIELGLQHSVVQISHPGLMRQPPGVAGCHHAVTIHRRNSVHKRLRLFAQRSFCCCFCGFRSCRCGFLRGGRFCKGKRTAQIAEQQNSCQQQCHPPFPEFNKMIRHNCLLYYKCILGYRSCCLFGLGRAGTSGASAGRPISGIKPPKRFGTKSESHVPPKVAWVCIRHMASFPTSSFTPSKG